MRADGVPMEVVVDQGFAVGVRNVDTLLAAMEPIFSMFEQDSPEAAEKTRALFADPQIGPQLLLRDVRPFWAMVCSEMHVGAVVQAPTQFPNPFGGAPIPGTESFALKSVDKTAGTATYETLTETDSEAIIAALEPVLAQILPPGAGPEQLEATMAQLPPIDTRATGTFVMSLADGMPLSVEVIQPVGAGEVVAKSDAWIWTRQ